MNADEWWAEVVKVRETALAEGRAQWNYPPLGDDEGMLTGFVTFSDMDPSEMNADQLECAMWMMHADMADELSSESPESVTLTAREFALVYRRLQDRKTSIERALDDL